MAAILIETVTHAAPRLPDTVDAALIGSWQVDLGDPTVDEATVAGWLTGDELAAAARGRGPVRRRRVLLRAALRQVLGDVLALPPGQVALGNDRGRPVLTEPHDGVRLHVSCSASGAVGLVAVSRGAAVGVDVEQHRDGDVDTAAAEGWLAPQEASAIAALPPGNRTAALTRCWTQKEAVLKGRGVGLRQDPSRVVTPVAAHGRVGSWQVTPVLVPVGFAASLALRFGGPLPDLRPTALTLGSTA